MKMGAPKKLPAFCAMLRAGLRGRPSSVSLELLTASDLEALKTRRQARDGAGQVPSSSGGGSVTGKRYLVVTHAPEFGDRLHLPLPLLPCESPPSLLRLPSAECILALRAENQALRGELATAQGLLGTSSLGRVTAGLSSGSATRALEARLEAAESELEALGMAHRALQKRAAAEVATLMAELSARRDGERDYRVRLASARAEVDALTRRLRATEARVGLRGSAASANFTYSRPGSRPSSRPSSPYAAAPGSRGASPARTSRPPSAPGSPYTSGHRPASAPRERPHSPVPVFDPTAYAADRAQRLAAAATLRASAFGGTSGRGSSPAPGSRSSTPTAGWRSPAQSPRRAGGAGGGAATGGAGLSPRESPRRALLHVKSKLHALTGKPLVPAAPTVRRSVLPLLPVRIASPGLTAVRASRRRRTLRQPSPTLTPGSTHSKTFSGRPRRRRRCERDTIRAASKWTPSRMFRRHNAPQKRPVARSSVSACAGQREGERCGAMRVGCRLRVALAALALLAVVGAQEAAQKDTESGGWDVLSAGQWSSLSPSYVLSGAATVETDIPVGSFAAFLNSGAQSGAQGRSRLNVSVSILFRGQPLTSKAVLVAHVHASSCSGSLPPGGPHYLFNASLPDDTLPVPPPAGTGQGVNTFSVRVPASGLASATQPFLVDYDRALSVVLHEGAAVAGYAPLLAGSRIGCADLVPTLPDLPQTYSMTIEANFGLSKAYTMVRQQYQSAAANKITAVQHSSMQRLVVIQDFNTNSTFTIQQNSSYPQGICEMTSCRGTPLSQCGTTVPDLSVLFKLGDGQPIAFEGVNLANVRGITCERWTRNYSFSSPVGTSSGTARYYVPVSSWHNRGEAYHRLLKRIEIFGSSAGPGGGMGSPYSHSYEFVDFVPDVINTDVFDPCRVLKMGPLGVLNNGTVTGCGCDTPAPAAQPASSGGSSGLAARIIIPLLTLVVGAGGGLFVGRMRDGAKGAPRGEEGVSLVATSSA